MTKRIIAMIVAIMLACIFGSVWAKEKTQHTTDSVELAAMMLKDGHYDRALLALESVNLDDKKTDLARFYTLQGLAYLNLNEFDAARDSLQLAVDNGQQDQMIFVYLAQAHYALKNYRKTIQAIEEATDHAKTNPALVMMKAQAYWHLKETVQSIDALNEGQKLFPADFRFLKLKVFSFVQLGLNQQAAILGKQYLEVSQAAAEDYVAIGNALRLSKEYQQALDILEIARLQFPGNDTVAKLLAHTYLDQGQFNSAAFILEQAALFNPELLPEAAEIYRRAGRFHKALTLNESVQDQKVKFKQRLSILLALKQYERAANMASSLYRTGLLDDESVRYALAYALFSSKRFPAANKHLDFLKEPELFKRGIELRRLMEVCKNEPWQCA